MRIFLKAPRLRLAAALALLLCMALGACATTEVQVRGQHEMVFGTTRRS